MAAYANQRTKANLYRQQHAMTAGPGELTLMLYDGCIKNIKQVQLHLQNRDIEKANETSLKAQAILSELMRTLDMQYEISQGLYQLYEYMLSELVAANVKKDAGQTDAVLELLGELRDTWQQAIRLNRQQMMGTGGSI
ncbi:MAG: flagellar export chaperone FliS [Oscillospiraceae bacterium]|jgi:flagellar protein FliS|nr:flagellar export chaperone FliS [Oscillospiraceae bacterium]